MFNAYDLLFNLEGCPLDGFLGQGYMNQSVCFSRLGRSSMSSEHSPAERGGFGSPDAEQADTSIGTP